MFLNTIEPLRSQLHHFLEPWRQHRIDCGKSSMKSIIVTSITSANWVTPFCTHVVTNALYILRYHFQVYTILYDYVSLDDIMPRNTKIDPMPSLPINYYTIVFMYGV